MCEYDTFDKTPLEFLRAGSNITEICKTMGITKRTLISKYRADLIKYVKELAKRGMTNELIKQMTGLSLNTIKRLKTESEKQRREISLDKKDAIITFSKGGVNPRAIASQLSMSIHDVKDVLKDLILLSFVKLNGIFKMQSEFSMDGRDLSAIIKKAGFTIPPSGLAKKIIDHFANGENPYYIELSERLIDIIEGELLGDGWMSRSIASIEGKRSYHDYSSSSEIKEYKEALDTLSEMKNAKNINEIPNLVEKFNKMVDVMQNTKLSSFRLHKNPKEWDWLVHLSKVFIENGYGASLMKKELEIGLDTKNSVQLQKIYERFYVNGVKILPEDFKLNVNKTLSWYVGDGYFNKVENRINFATHNFKEGEVRNLSEQLNREAGIESKVNKVHDHRYPESEYWVINIRRKDDVDKFFKYLEKADKESLEVAKKTVSQKFRS